MKHFKILYFTGVVMLMLVANLFSQGPDTLWTRTYGGEHDDCCYSVIENSNGEYILAGWTRSFGTGGKDVYLLKIDVNGDTVWTRTYGGVNDDEGRYVQETLDNGYIIAGSTESFGAGASDMYLIKTYANGDTIWTTTCGMLYSEYGYSIQQTSDSGYIITGRISSFSVGGFDVFLVKLDEDGNILWAKFIGDIGWDVSYSVEGTSDGGYIIGGSTLMNGSDWDVYLVKTDADGDTMWTKTYGGMEWDVGFEIQETSDTGFILVGMTESSGAGSFDIYLIKVDSLGNTLWTRTHGDVGWDEGYSVQQISDGGYILVGATESLGEGDFDIYFSRTYPNGYALWTEIYGGDEHDVGYSVKETSDSGYIIAGKTKSFGSGLYDVYLIKTQPDLGIEEQESHSKEYIPFLEVFPNPFRKRVNIKYCIEQSAEGIELKIYDVSGRLVKGISLPTAYSPGLAPRSGAGLLPTVITWDGLDNRRERVSGGVYFLKIISGDVKITRKLMMIQ